MIYLAFPVSLRSIDAIINHPNLRALDIHVEATHDPIPVHYSMLIPAVLKLRHLDRACIPMSQHRIVKADVPARGSHSNRGVNFSPRK
jgi:hypothetical protein